MIHVFFLYNTPTTEIHTLSLHDALPIYPVAAAAVARAGRERAPGRARRRAKVVAELRTRRDRKSTRLNSSHVEISYAVFCLKKKIDRTSLSIFQGCRFLYI